MRIFYQEYALQNCRLSSDLFYTKLTGLQIEMKCIAKPETVVLKQHFERKLVELEEEKQLLQVEFLTIQDIHVPYLKPVTVHAHGFCTKLPTQNDTIYQFCNFCQVIFYP